MKVAFKSIVLLTFCAWTFNAHALLNILPDSLDSLINDADTASKIHSTFSDKIQAMTELNKWYELVSKIYNKTSAIIGNEFLSVKQLSELKVQFKQELTKIKREKNLESAQELYSKLGKNPEGISYKALKHAVEVAQEAKKWLSKAHAAQLKPSAKPKSHMKVARR